MIMTEFLIEIDYRKVASSRLVYYSIFDHFWGATNQDVLQYTANIFRHAVGIN